jgi:hypothetical protein
VGRAATSPKNTEGKSTMGQPSCCARMGCAPATPLSLLHTMRAGPPPPRIKGEVYEGTRLVLPAHGLRPRYALLAFREESGCE